MNDVIRTDLYTEVPWQDASAVQRFRWAAEGLIALERGAFCRRLAIRNYPRRTMFWNEWCRWLYHRLTDIHMNAPWHRNTSDKVSTWWADQLEPLLEKKERKTVPNNLPLDQHLLYDGYSYSNKTLLVAEDRHWLILAQTESHTRSRYRVVMLLHHNNIAIGAVKWAVLTHDRPEGEASTKHCVVEPGTYEQTIKRYSELTTELARDGCESQRDALAGLAGEVMKLGRPQTAGDA